MTIKAIAVKDGMDNSEVATATYTLKVAIPTFLPIAGAVTSGTTVTITATGGATIYYTMGENPADPTSSSTTYSSPITITEATTIKAIAIKSNWTDSEVVSAEYTILAPAATPTFSPAAGTYTTAQTVELSSTTEGATIYYTTDGTDPTTSSNVYSSPISVSETKTIKAIAMKDGFANSAVVVATYTIEIPCYTVTLSDDPSNPMTEYSAGVGVTLPTRSAIGSYTFAGWTATNIPTETTTAPANIISAGTYYPTANITLYPVYTKTEGSGTTERTASVTIADYASANNWVNGDKYHVVNVDANVSVTTNDKGTTGQYNSTNNYWGMYQTSQNASQLKVNATTGNTLKSVTFTYTANNTGVLVYNEAQYASGAAVTLSGNQSSTFTVGNTGSATNGQARITAISVIYDASSAVNYYWSTPVAAAVERPVINVAEQFYVSTPVTITCETEDAAIYYTLDGTDPTASSTAYNGTFNLTSGGTIKAIAVKGSDVSEIASKAVTKNLATPTVTVSGDLTLDLDGETNVNAGTLTTAVTYNDAAVQNATVTWSSSDTDIATINAETGAVTIIATGEVTFTATFAANSDFTTATGTKTVTVVDSNVPGLSVDNPYTVAEALTAIQALPDNNATSDKYYIRGVVSGFYGSATGITSASSKRYYISTDEATADQLLVYSGKGLGNVAFSSDNDLCIGDQVIVYGAIQNYNGDTPEIAANNYIVKRFCTVSFTATNCEMFVFDAADENNDLTTGNQLEVGKTIMVSVVPNASPNYGEPEVTVKTSNNDNVTLTYVADGDYYTFTLASPVTISATAYELQSNEIVLDDDDEDDTHGSTTYGTPLEIAYAIEDGTTLTYTISNSAIADVTIGDDVITLTPKATGTAVITFSAAATSQYTAAEDVTYTLTVTAPAASNEAYASSFNKVTATSQITNGQYLIVYETGSVAFDGGRETLDAAGNTIEVTISNNAIAANATTEAAAFTINAVDGGYSIQSASGKYIGRTATTNGFNESASEVYTNTITIDNSGNAVITSSGGPTLQYYLSGNDSRFRYYASSQKAIQLYKRSAITVTLNASGYATFCSEYPLDFTDHASTDYSAWTVSEVNTTTGVITFNQVTGVVAGGTGLLIKGTPNSTVTLTSNAEGAAAPTQNLLYGTLAPTNIAAGRYAGLSGNKFVNVNAGTVPAHKALLTLPANGGNVKSFTFKFNDLTTGVITIDNGQLTIDNEAIYNLSGQRLSKPAKGINIINGKKVLVK